jgi:5S rRNA maturation endonuclease (ribonuclease M5)
MTVDEFLDKLDGVRAQGNGWVARCPSHEDRNASLTIAEGDVGLILHCHAGCTFEEVMKAVGAKQEPEAIYSYTDEEGNELFQAVRFPGKQFRYRRFDPFNENTDGEAWVWSIGDARRVLYNLPEVVWAIENSRPVYVVEGEKDVESFRSLGLDSAATTNPMGSGAWRDEYGLALAAARLVRVVADKDEAGHKWARAVVRSLEGLVDEVRVYEAKEGKDLSDHLEAGHKLEDLVRITLPKRERHYQPLDLFRPVPPVKWVVQNALVEGEATLLVADGGTGKSYFALAMALAVADGSPFIDCQVTQGKVIYVDEEGSPDLALQRFAELGATDEQRRNIDYLNFAGVDLVKHPNRLKEDALLVKPRLVVIDSHAKVTRMSEENSNNEMGRVWDDGFLPLARETGAAVLVIHHTNGVGGSRGASQIRNSADQVLTMERQGDGSMKVWPSKQRRLTKPIEFWFRNIGMGRYELASLHQQQPWDAQPVGAISW